MSPIFFEGDEFRNMILQVKNIRKAFSKHFSNNKIIAIDDISFSINKNEIFGYLGPNGAGKTTTIKMIMGLLKPNNGNIEIFDSNINNKAIRKRIGYLPENPSFYPFLTAYETLKMICALYDIDKTKQDDRIKTFLSLVGLNEVMNRRVGSFSKGMVQRLGIAQAIINDPELIILDEPLSGLDPIGRKEIKDIILLMKRRGKTIMFSSHILPDIEMIADRVCIINKGKIMGTGYINDIIKRQLKEIDMEVLIDDPKCLEEYRNKCKFFAERDNIIYMTIEDENTARAIIKTVKDQNGKILSYVPRESKLEDYFVDMIKVGDKEK